MKRRRAANSLIPSLTCLSHAAGVGARSEGEDTNPGGVATGGVITGGVATRGADTGGVTDGLNSCGYLGVGIKSP